VGLTGDDRSGFDQSDPRAKPDLEKDLAELTLGAVGEGTKTKMGLRRRKRRKKRKKKKKEKKKKNCTRS
jgi:hypothetical protein